MIIQLTLEDRGQPIYFNTDAITYFIRSSMTTGSRVYTATDYYVVEEAPDEILTLMESMNGV
jgi:hypothetical protein